jgi:Transcriptional regulator, AbiEi antitoxin, Type IV TA system/Transcriptional regulator, AbiEi antitoxin N-terminal domain
MTAPETGKLKRLLDLWPAYVVMTSARLAELGISHGLARQYVKNGWMDRVGVGAFKRPNDSVSWTGAVESLQTQLQMGVHVGALTALAVQGYQHYLRLEREAIFLFSAPDVVLPAWFKGHDWGATIQHVATKLLPDGLGLLVDDVQGHKLTLSTPERAILECLYLSPDRVDLIESVEVAQGLLTLRPDLMQVLLEACNSIKVRRLFLFIAEKNALPVLKRLDLTRIDLGSGARSIVKGGVYHAGSRLTLPRELVGNG